MKGKDYWQLKDSVSDRSRWRQDSKWERMSETCWKQQKNKEWFVQEFVGWRTLKTSYIFFWTCLHSQNKCTSGYCIACAHPIHMQHHLHMHRMCIFNSILPCTLEMLPAKFISRCFWMQISQLLCYADLQKICGGHLGTFTKMADYPTL